MSVLGVDACRRGWMAVCLDADGTASGHFGEHLSKLIDRVPDVETVGIDIPIGLPVHGRRLADVAARDRLGPRRQSVFMTPVRAAITAPSHAAGTQISVLHTGHGMSQQAYRLGPKILETEAFVAAVPIDVREVHPEVSFSVLLGHPATYTKKTWAGMEERRRALHEAGIDLRGIGSAGRHAAPDDVLDAAVAAWTARRVARGAAISVPDPPETPPGGGRPMAIWA